MLPLLLETVPLLRLLLPLLLETVPLLRLLLPLLLETVPLLRLLLPLLLETVPLLRLLLLCDLAAGADDLWVVVLLELEVVADLCDEVAGALLTVEDDDLRFRSPLCEAADPEVLLFCTAVDDLRVASPLWAAPVLVVLLLCTAEDDLRDSPFCPEAWLPELRELVADELLLWLSDDAAGRAEVLREP